MRWNESWNQVNENGKQRAFRKIQFSAGDKFKNLIGVVQVTGFNVDAWQGTEDGGISVKTELNTIVKYHCYATKTNHTLDLLPFIQKLGDENFEYIGS